MHSYSQRSGETNFPHWLMTIRNLQSLYKALQAGGTAICYSEADLGSGYFFPLLEEQVRGWELQRKPRLSLYYNYLHDILFSRPLCAGALLCCLQRPSPTFQASA